MDNLEFKRHFISNYTCPECEHRVVLCDFSGCLNEATYEGWFGSGLIRRMNACDEHIRLSRGWNKHKEEQLAMEAVNESN